LYVNDKHAHATWTLHTLKDIPVCQYEAGG